MGATAVNPGDVFLWQQDVQSAKKRISLLLKNKTHTYALVFGQCPLELDGKIKGLDADVQADANQDVVQLLVTIRGYYQFDNHQQSTYTLKSAKHRVSTFFQSYKAMTTEYVEHFKALVDIVEKYSIAYENESGLIKAQLTAQGVVVAYLDNPNPAKLVKALEVCRAEYLLCMILRGSDNTRFYQLKINLANSMTMKRTSSQRPWWRRSVSSTIVKCHQDICASGARTAMGLHLYRTMVGTNRSRPHHQPKTSTAGTAD